MAVLPSQTRWPSGARYLAVILLLLGILGIVLFIKPVLSTVALGFIMAFLFYSPIQGMSKRFKFKYGMALGLFYLLVVIIILVIIIWFGRGIVNNVQSLVDQIPDRIAAFEMPAVVPDTITAGIEEITNLLHDALKNFLSNVASFIGTIFVALFFSALLLLNLTEARGALSSLIPEHHQKDIRQILSNLDRVWVGYMTAQVIYCIILAAGSFLEFSLLGVPYPGLMAVLTGVLSLIPTIGGIVSDFVVIIPCLLFGSTRFTEMPPVTFAIIVALVNMVITQVSYNFVALPIIGRMVSLPTAAVLIGVLAGVAMGNIMLAFLVIPILSTLVITGGYLLSKVSGREYKPDAPPMETGKDGFFSQLMAEKEPVQPAEAA